MKLVLNSRQKFFVFTSAVLLFLTVLIALLWPRHTSPIAQPLVLPEPQSLIEKVSADSNNWQEITTQSGDSLATLFSHMGLSTQTLHLIIDKNPHAKLLTQIRPNQTVKFLIEGTALKQLIIPISKTESIRITQDNEQYKTRIETLESYTKPEVVHATVQHSLYLTAKKAKIPYSLIQEMTEILAWQMNFSREVRAGDSFTIHYEAHYIEDEKIKNGDILAVSYTTRNKTYQAIRYKTKSGKVDYYTPEGKSVRKAFTRYPLNFSHISSSFNLSRMHPVLKERRPHRGVDLAAPIGTPIRATSDGRIASIGYENGYGNKIKLKHSGPYASVYAHLLKFKKGLKRGDFVEKGEVIGYVGQTGLATGPHCHYEFHVNDKPQNPSTVKLPDAISIPETELAAFKMRANTALALLAQAVSEKVT